MLYTFKSKATGNLIMLQANGTRLLRIIGKEPAARGIVLPDQMPAAILALEAAIAQEDAARREAEQIARDAGETVDEPAEVSLRQRVRPFIEMLQRCQAAGESIVWGV
jgi:Domain of unknown function (DUF1840)